MRSPIGLFVRRPRLSSRTLAFVAAVGPMLVACASPTGGRSPEPSGEVAAAVNATSVLKLGAVPWPTIHFDEAATNEAPYCGPVSDLSSTTPPLVPIGNTIVNLHGPRYVYAQPLNDAAGPIVAYDPSSFKDPIARYELGAVYPNAGGGAVDSNGRTWWTANAQVVRLDENLAAQTAVKSAKLPDAAYNGTTFLPDGNLLVTAMPQYAVVGTAPVNGELPVLATGSLADLQFQGANPTVDAGFGPRPLTDGQGHYFFVIDRSIFRVTYDPVTHRLATANGNRPDWEYVAPSGLSFGDSHGVLVGGRLCAHAAPVSGVAGTNVTCLDVDDGTVVGTATAFPGSTALKSTWHNLGVAPNGYLIAINDSSDGSGGATGIDPATVDSAGQMRVVWERTLPNISQAIVIAGKSGKLYLSSRKSARAPYVVNAINVANGARTTVYSTTSIGGMPNKSLGFVGLGTAVYIPTPSGILQLKDAAVPTGCP